MSGRLTLFLLVFGTVSLVTMVGFVVLEKDTFGHLDKGRLKVEAIVSVLTGLIAGLVLATTVKIQ